MNKTIASAALLAAIACSTAFAQEQGYTFTPVKELKITPVENQNRAGTCWSYSGLAHLESELIRMGKGEHNLSEMFIVSHSYRDKGDLYVRTHGVTPYVQGGSFYDVLYVLKHYGIVPESAMKGLEYGEENHVHGELETITGAYLKAVTQNKNGKLSSAWKKGFNATIDAYLGELPEKFSYKGKEYTPKSFLAELGLNPDDYVSLTSFTHHPFYTSFALEIPDNWRWSTSYNLPLDELMQVFDQAINTGYSIAWASDVSEKGFTRNGIAVVPDVEAIETSGSDQDRWVGLSRKEKEDMITKMIESPCKELCVSQEMRQAAYDNYQTTDDHGMQIYGIAKDQNGTKYYMVKNSWGTDNKYKGTWYASEAFVSYKTMSIVVHKDALPKAIKSKLGIN